MNHLNKILIANRGEIALRILRAADALNIRTVAIYSAGEENAPHVFKAGESVSLGEGSLNDTYLNIGKIIAAAKATGAEAIHPGYGFLSESYLLAEACENNGIRFIGPSPEVLKLMGNKLEAKALAEKLEIPVLWNHTVSAGTVGTLAPTLSYPVLIKSAHGGGGKGMQIAYSADDLEDKVTRASRMALTYFGNGEVYLEPFIEKARHIEVQVLGDHHGNLVHLYERDCTLQRNYQKIIEEAPAPGLSGPTRQALLDAAVKLCRSVHYSGAGTVEFLLGSGEQFFFMEMNPRIQVEHPVTEEVTGIDIVMEQLRITAGEPLSFTQESVDVKGHAMEVRIYSEDPAKGFSPSTAPVSFFRLPIHPDIRLETDLSSETEFTGSQFDPLLCKIITRGNSRVEAIETMEQALNDTIISGPATNQPLLRALLRQNEVRQALTDTRYCENELPGLLDDIKKEKDNLPTAFLAAAFLYLKFLPQNGHSANPFERLGFRNILNQVDIKIGDQRFEIQFSLPDHKMIKTADRLLKNELTSGALPFSFTWKNISLQLAARLLSPDTIRITSEEGTTEFPFRVNHLGQTVFYWHGMEIIPESADLMEYYPKTGNLIHSGLLKGDNLISSPLHGKVIDIQVKTDQIISKGDLLLIIESMKSENHITAHKPGKIKTIEVAVGEQVTDQMPLITLEEI